MLDTLKLYLEDYIIEKQNNITFQPAPRNAGSGEIISEHYLFRNTEGKTFQGSKAYLNTERLNLSIQPFNKGEGDIDRVGCYVQFSVPKVHNGNNYYGVGEQGTGSVIGKVEKELSENGIKTNLLNSHISRIDTFKNIVTEEQFSSYYSLFTLLKARRAIQRGYGTTWLVHNTQQEFCVYDKLEEMRKREVDTSIYPENTMRFEHRLMNKKKVESVYGFSLLKDVFSGGYGLIKDNQSKVWEKSLFSFDVEEIIMLGSKEIETEMRFFQNRYSRNWFSYFLRSYGALHLAKYAGIDVVKSALSNLESDRMKVYRAGKELEKAKKEIDMVKREQGSDKTLSTLYQELKTKVCLN